MKRTEYADTCTNNIQYTNIQIIYWYSAANLKFDYWMYISDKLAINNFQKLNDSRIIFLAH